MSVPAGAAQAAPAAVENELLALAQVYLQAGANVLVTNPASAAAAPADEIREISMSRLMQARVLAQRAKMAALRARLAAAEVTYRSTQVTIEDSTVTVSGNTATVALRDITVLTPTATTEPVTEQAVDRTLEYVKAGTTWSLDGEALETGSLAPITAPGSDVAALPSPAPGPIGTEPVDTGTDGPLDDTEKAEDSGWQDPELVETPVTGSAPVAGEAKPEGEQAARGISTMARPAGMCYGCMRDYAYAHWKNYHKGYRVWKGNDCTNFLSQIMRRGGWKDDKGWYQSSANWWYTSSHQTWTWAGAENWSKFAPKRTDKLNNVWKLGLADVLQLDFNRDGIMDHSMVVTKVTSKDIYLTYHSTNTKDRSLRAILKAYPNAWYYAYRT